MRNNFVEEQEEIDEFYKEKQYIDCLQKCIKVVSKIDKTNVFNNYKLFFCYLRMANIYAEIDHIDKALKYTKKTALYQETIQDSILVNWTFSYCYYKLGDKKAVKFIDYAIKDCCMIESEDWLYQALVHKSLLTSDEDLMLKSIEILETMGINDNRMDALYLDTFNMYMNLNNTFKAEGVILKIKSKMLKENLHKRIFQSANADI